MATTLTRWYIDTRPLTQSTSNLPLLSTLQEPDQTSIQKYLRLSDRHMSLASNLLKYLFIHRTCRIPWSEVRPCFVPSVADVPAAEFNVTHQASFVALAGCLVPSTKSDGKLQGQDEIAVATQAVYSEPEPSSAPIPAIPQVGIDVTCVDEPGRRRDKAPMSLKDVTDFIDIFKDVFSQRELETMKQAASTSSTSSLAEVIKSSLRLFYAYWALKEAYIKMTGEALLAPWLRELEFTNVVAPAPVADADAWGEPYRGVQTWLYGKKVEDVRVELVAFESDYLLATAARGANLGSSGLRGGDDAWKEVVSIDIERDVRPCAMGECQCLDG
ncbi:4'-phosphopantetheinyl transferase NpgA/CfwA [Talaromyces stipitatus ATCC 10500]|uniref:holo-[acyl-carrier-protein] synthase n=1 Tax=Talaromyces stipitatus (strain ATCC 10500 / CBS 375.48 / QM 6759 / NRRL 1006) TaxID=441959 RepID=B8M1J3_TALSN|nr:4'-phosphopantetheinyl transferase NpgA/CfwA [Talaromyces stipitatus ATCC 10500]EED21889.1 4'-phosphopantetheinyl transferase NpgA/CfwA [Talaromyces stipitatus ATCC 10500]